MTRFLRVMLCRLKRRGRLLTPIRKLTLGRSGAKRAQEQPGLRLVNQSDQVSLGFNSM
jgi:hypothetical protein